MGQFRMKIAGQVGEITTCFDSTVEYCRPYLTTDSPDFSAVVTAEDRAFEQAASIAEAIEEGIRPRKYGEPHLERSAIQRKFAEFLFDRDILMLHGSAVALDGAGYLFTADCGTGKSTHTRLWREAFGDRALMINDDKPFLTIREGTVEISGSPWSGKHGLDTNITVPLAGICVLHRGSENRIRSLDPEDAMAMLLKQTYRPLAGSKHDRFFTLVEHLAATVPLWELECTKEPEAAIVSHAAMAEKHQ